MKEKIDPSLHGKILSFFGTKSRKNAAFFWKEISLLKNLRVIEWFEVFLPPKCYFLKHVVSDTVREKVFAIYNMSIDRRFVYGPPVGCQSSARDHQWGRGFSYLKSHFLYYWNCCCFHKENHNLATSYSSGLWVNFLPFFFFVTNHRWSI